MSLIAADLNAASARLDQARSVQRSYFSVTLIPSTTQRDGYDARTRNLEGSRAVAVNHNPFE